MVVDGGAVMEWWNWFPVFAPVVTALGVIAALGIAVAGARERAADRRREQQAEARMLQVIGVDFPVVDGHDVVRWHVRHHGPHLVFRIRYEAWSAKADLTGRPTWALQSDAAFPLDRGQDPDPAGDGPVNGGVFFGGTVTTRGEGVDPADGLAAWRVRWTDRYGNQWTVDGRDQDARPYVPGDPPRRYDPSAKRGGVLRLTVGRPIFTLRRW